MASYAYRLVIRSGPEVGKEFPLIQPEIQIGRDVNNDIGISDVEVSRKHARIFFQSGYYLIEDLGSTNGTFLNGARITSPQVLQHGSLVQLGETVVLVFEAMQPEDQLDATFVADPRAVQTREDVRPVIDDYQIEPPPQGFPPEAMVSESDMMPGEGEMTDNRRLWMYVGIGCGILFICAIISVLALWYIDTNCLWCDTFPFIPGCDSPNLPACS